MRTWRWLAEHWQAICAAAAGVAGSTVGVLTYIRKTRAEARLAELTFKTKLLARALSVYADQMKQATHTKELLFHEEELKNAIGKDATLLHETLTLMESDGRARRSFPGYWVIQ